MNNGKYCPEIVEKICGYIRDGVPNKYAAQAAGISEDRFYVWLKEHDEFKESVEKAYADFLADNVKIVKRAADRNWQAAAWFLERRHKDHFALKQEIAAEVKGEQTIIYKPEKRAEGERG